jgi:hypothetical protein
MDPTKYQRGYSFSGYQATNPKQPLPAPRVDDELLSIEKSIGGLVDGMKNIRRADGRLQNGIVTADALSTSLTLGFDLRGAWSAGQSYRPGDGVLYGSKVYKARSAHVATEETRPDLAPDFWLFLFDLITGAMPPTEFSTRAVLSNSAVLPGVAYVRTAGYATVGDGGGALYLRAATEPTHAGKVKSADGAWWEITGTELNVQQFGANMTGTVSAVVAIQAAIDTALAIGVKQVWVHPKGKYLIDQILKVRKGITLRGHYSGSAGNWNDSRNGGVDGPLNEYGSALYVHPNVQIYVYGMAGLNGLVILRSGLTFPVADATVYSGTAILAAGDENWLENLLVVGFDRLYESYLCARQRIRNVNGDCTNGFRIARCYDVPYLTDCHLWPFGTGASAPIASRHRQGIAFAFDTIAAFEPGASPGDAGQGVDLGKLGRLFAYGYKTGYFIKNSSKTILVDCAADNTNNLSGAVGFHIQDSASSKLIGCTAFGLETAVVLDHTGYHTSIIGLSVNAAAAVTGQGVGVAVLNGDVTVIGSTFEDLKHVISNGSTTSRIVFDANYIKTLTPAAINTVGTRTIFVGPSNNWGMANGVALSAAMLVQQVASGSVVSLPPSGDVFEVTGTTGIGAIAGGWAGRQVTLKFAASVQLFNGDGSTGGMRLNGSATFSAVARSTITLRHDGAKWYEVGRST